MGGRRDRGRGLVASLPGSWPSPCCSGCAAWETEPAGQLVLSNGTQNVLIIVPMGLSTVSYAVTVWKAATHRC